MSVLFQHDVTVLKGTFCAAYPSALNTNFQRKMHGNASGDKRSLRKESEIKINTMRKTLKKTALAEQRKKGKRNVVNLLKQFRKDFKQRAKEGRMSVSYRNLDGEWDALVALRYLRIHSDLKFEFYGEFTGGLAPNCKVSWD